MKMHNRSLYFTLFLLCCVSIASAQRRDSQPVSFNKISDNLYEVVGGRGARGGFYIGDDSVLLIDTKMDMKSQGQVIEKIKDITDKPIKYLVNTHSDGDHISGNKFSSEALTIIAHENCRKEFFHPRRDGSPSEWNDPKLMSFIPSITFNDRLDLYLGSKKVELYHFGIGHTTGDTVVYFPEEKTAFVGDQLIIARPQLIHTYKGGNSFGHVKNLTKMLETLDAQQFCSGHDEMTDRQGVKKHIGYMENLQKKVQTSVENNKSLEETKSMFEENEARLIEVIYKEINR